MSPFKFIVELTPPLHPREIHDYYSKFCHLLDFTSSFGIISRPVGNVDGFDRAYNLARFLVEKCEDIDLLFHLTCRDLNRINIDTRIKLLKDLRVTKLLLISGQNYQPPSPGKASALYFLNSTELAGYIEEHYGRWFDSIAIAGYPNEIHNGECWRLRIKMSMIRRRDTIYTQCIFRKADEFNYLRETMKKFDQKLKLVPALPVFCDYDSLKKAYRLTIGEAPDSNAIPLPQLEYASDSQYAKCVSLDYLRDLCLKLKDQEESTLVYLCTFNRFELVGDLIERIKQASAVERIQ